MSAEERLARLAQEISVCQQCPLRETRKKAVPGEGPADAEIMLIGEGPGFHENEQGRPFVGAAGKFLEQLLEQANLARADVFIANVVKCRPPGNRDPQPEELAACAAYLDAQIEIVNPSVVVTLGRFSMAKFIPDAKISAVHGQMRKAGERFVVPMFHPAAALHQPQLRPAILGDFAKLPQQLAEARRALGKPPLHFKGEAKGEDKPRQLSLF